MTEDTWRYQLDVADDLSQEHVDALVEERDTMFRERIYSTLCRMADASGYVAVNPNEGFDWIARRALDPETATLISREGEFDNYDDEAWILFDVRENLQLCIGELHAMGRIEWVIRSGWPWIHVPDSASIHIESDTDWLAANAAERVARLEELRSMPYPEYLRTPEWQERRALHLEHAQHRCQVCNREGNLHVHHRTYARRGNERFSDLIVLCAACHQHFHEKLRVSR